MKENKLTKKQFAGAVSKGLGRAMIYVRQYGPGKVADGQFYVVDAFDSESHNQ